MCDDSWLRCDPHTGTYAPPPACACHTAIVVVCNKAVGEYYLASAFEKIFIQPSGYVGLTGMGQDRVFLKRFIDRYGIKAEIFSREVGAYWCFGDPQSKYSATLHYIGYSIV